MPKLRWVLFYAVTTFIVAVTLVTFFKERHRIDRLAASLESRMEEFEEMTRRNQEIQEKISYYQTPSGITFLAIDEYNLVRSGEKIYRIEIISGDDLRNE
ncbi:MAG: septum formation initiator family protein [Synergistaceae bacterium]|jgi:cell division protein FtsB|nr:septum formation initiator family protein [Synergistaceae bacterium]